AVIIGLISCTTYKTKYVGFRPAGDYPNSRIAGGLTVGAEAFADRAAAKEAFGFDVKKAGLLPVQLVMDNKSGDLMQVVTDQTFLVDNNNRYWTLIANRTAVKRVTDATQTGAILSGAGKGAGWGAATGAVLGAAFGIVTGENVADSAGKGAAVGAAGGAVYKGADKGTEGGRSRTIADDLRDKGLEGKTLPDQSIANGFLFFPSEATSARELKLQMKEVHTGRIYNFSLPF
ncbi:MAG: hypothetical protein R3297_03090, partial [Desulfobulbales bacterium]|nr:hypothetical protein [Desulfobulbales bacterium]